MNAPNSLPNIIVTGSSGLIGTAFIDRIGARYREFGFDREGRTFIANGDRTME